MCSRDSHLSGAWVLRCSLASRGIRSAERTAHLINHTDRCAMDLATSRR
jgi:hypothetical protein